MILWIDAQISPVIALWIAGRFAVQARHVKDLGLAEASDPSIFEAARIADAVMVTKDRDFVDLCRRRGIPPQVLWLTCGNTSTREVVRILEATFESACELLALGESFVEIKG